MGTKSFSWTALATADAVACCTLPRDMGKLLAEAKAVLHTASLGDRLMSEVSAFRGRLGVSSLAWLATEAEAKLCMPEQQGSDGYWWFVWAPDRAGLRAGLEDIARILQVAEREPQLFGASAAEVRAAFDWDGRRGKWDFEIPDGSGGGDDPQYVLCALLAFMRLLDLSLAEGLQVVHFRYSHRPRPRQPIASLS